MYITSFITIQYYIDSLDNSIIFADITKSYTISIWLSSGFSGQCRAISCVHKCPHSVTFMSTHKKKLNYDLAILWTLPDVYDTDTPCDFQNKGADRSLCIISNTTGQIMKIYYPNCPLYSLQINVVISDLLYNLYKQISEYIIGEAVVHL